MNDPAHRERAAQYVQQVVQRYKNHPAHAAWLLMNEPHPMFHVTPATMRCFGAWLQQRYGNIEVLNQRWFRQFARFEEVEVQPDQWDTFWCDYPSFLDWNEFQLDNLRAQRRWSLPSSRQVQLLSSSRNRTAKDKRDLASRCL